MYRPDGVPPMTTLRPCPSPYPTVAAALVLAVLVTVIGLSLRYGIG